MLTGNLCLLSIIFGITYLFIDIGFGRNAYLFTYAVLAGGSLLSLIMLRVKKYTAGRLLYLISNLLILVIYAMIEPSNNGIYLFFIVLVVASLTIFGPGHMWYGIGSALLILFLFLALYIGEWTVLDPKPMSAEYYHYAFAINFVMALILITLMMNFKIRINNQALNNVRQKEADLIKLTSELSESRNRFKLALKGSSAGIWDWDARNDTLYISPLVNRILGYPLEKTIDADREKFFSIIHPDDKEMVAGALNHHLNSQERFEVEFRLRHGDGHYIWVLDTGQAEWDEAGKPIRMVGSLIDISERKRAEKKIQEQNEMLEKTNEELDRFVYSVSHDLKSPLSSILGLMSIAELSKDKEEIMQCIRMMRERVDTLNGFIEEIIDYSRNTRTDAEYSQTNLRALIEIIIDGLKYMENMSAIRIDVNVPPDKTVHTDPGRLKIVLNNLIGNAVKYHSLRQEDPYIRIGWKECDDHYEVIVEDNGQGIDEKIRERVFEMFYRGHESSKGSGLGLYIAREMVRKLHGELSLESEKNKGSAFTIRLPQNPPA